MTIVRSVLARGVVAALALGHLTCDSVPLLAPPNSTFSMFANPDFIPAHGGVSRITVIAIDGTGAPVPDGTVIYFVTTLGSIDRIGRTNDGIAIVNLVSDSRSGEATVSAFSGGTPSAPASPTTTTTTMTPSTTLRPSSATGVSAMGDIRTAAGAQNIADTVVMIGNVNANSVIVRAEPPRIGASRSTVIIATVFDASGNPISNVPVYFSAHASGGTSSTPCASPLSSTEFFDNAGPVFTDNNGEAESVLRTRRDSSGFVAACVEVPGPAPDDRGVVVPIF